MKTKNDIHAYLYMQNWTFAKTYADKAPHEYIVRGKAAGTDEEFVEAVTYIRENGIPMRFWDQEYTYLYLDGRLYWTMGEPIEDTNILNRCNLSDCEITISPIARDDRDNELDLKNSIERSDSIQQSRWP